MSIIQQQSDIIFNHPALNGDYIYIFIYLYKSRNTANKNKIYKDFRFGQLLAVNKGVNKIFTVMS